MTLATRKVDDRSRVVLPEKFAGKTVLMKVISADEILITLKKTPRRRPSVTELVSRITDENRHDPVDFGPPVGAESL